MPCENGGTCHDLINDFSCSCPKGTSGMFCEVDEFDCFESACHHGGTCIDEVGFCCYSTFFTLLAFQTSTVHFVLSTRKDRANLIIV